MQDSKIRRAAFLQNMKFLLHNRNIICLCWLAELSWSIFDLSTKSINLMSWMEKPYLSTLSLWWPHLDFLCVTCQYNWSSLICIIWSDYCMSKANRKILQCSLLYSVSANELVYALPQTFIVFTCFSTIHNHACFKQKQVEMKPRHTNFQVLLKQLCYVVSASFP